MLKVSNVNAGYGLLNVLNNLTLEIHEGEIVSLLGSNGAGKTTFVKALSGIMGITSGQIEFLGKPLNQLEPHKRVEMGLVQVPEGRRIFPGLTVRENLELGSLSRHAKAKRSGNMEQILQTFPLLKQKEHQTAGELSGGQQQMLAIGRALMAMPKLLILDEPSLGLAPIVTKQIFETIYNLNKREKLTILIIEQNVHAALAMADRGYVIENGNIILSGAAHDLLNNEQLKSAYLGA